MVDQLGVESDLIRWTESFVSDRKIRQVRNGQEGDDHEVDTGIRRALRCHRSFSLCTYLSSSDMWRSGSRASGPYLSWTTSPGQHVAGGILARIRPRPM